MLKKSLNFKLMVSWSQVATHTSACRNYFNSALTQRSRPNKNVRDVTSCAIIREFTQHMVLFSCVELMAYWHFSLHWRHNGCDSVSKHQPHDCLLNRLFRCRSKNTSKLRVPGLCVGNSPGTGEFTAQMASNAEMFPFDDVIMFKLVAVIHVRIYVGGGGGGGGGRVPWQGDKHMIDALHVKLPWET